MRAPRQEVAHFRLPERAMRSAIGLLTLPATPIESSDLFTEAVELVTMHEQPVGGPATYDGIWMERSDELRSVRV